MKKRRKEKSGRYHPCQEVKGEKGKSPAIVIPYRRGSDVEEGEGMPPTSTGQGKKRKEKKKGRDKESEVLFITTSRFLVITRKKRKKEKGPIDEPGGIPTREVGRREKKGVEERAGSREDALPFQLGLSILEAEAGEEEAKSKGGSPAIECKSRKKRKKEKEP